MNKAQLTNLLNLTYEMEGLTELALRRHPDTPSDIYNLIAEKAYTLANTAAAAMEQAEAENVKESGSTDNQGVNSVNDLETILEQKRNHTEVDNEDDETDVRELLDDEDALYLPTEEATAIDNDFDPEQPEEEPSKNQARKALKTYFSINDNYLYRRELFGNNDADYRASMLLLEAMPSIREAEEYLYNDLQLNAEDESVKNFVNILQKYFDQD